MNGSEADGQKAATSNLRFSAVRRRFSRPLLVVYSRQKSHTDNSDEDRTDTTQGVDRDHAKDEDIIGKVVGKNGQVGVNADDKKSRKLIVGKATTKIGTSIQDILDARTTVKVRSSRPLFTRPRQTTGRKNRRRNEQRHHEWQKRDSLSRMGVVVKRSKHAEQRRVRESEAVNALARPRRTRRGLLDNKVDVPDNSRQGYAPELVFDYVDPSRPSTSLRRAGHQKTTPSAASTFIEHELDTEQSHESVFDIMNRKSKDSRARQRKNRVRGRRRKQSSLMTQLQHPNDYFVDKHASTAAVDSSCQKQQMRVSFADIGWADRIIAPEYFDAFYCNGSCSFPIAKVRIPLHQLWSLRKENIELVKYACVINRLTI